nr:hypothetical protein [Tanacetum cinerariifolium]
MHKAFPLLGIEFPLAKEVPTASEEGCHCQKKREATVRKIALLSKSRRNRESLSIYITFSFHTHQEMDQQYLTVTKIPILDTRKFEQWQFWIQQYLQQEHYALWEATKKTKKNLLKQQYGNFKAKGSETLEQAFKRLQVIVGQLQFMDVEINQDDLNQKFLTSLALEWRMHTIVWRNMSDLDTMSLDDLYNHLKVASISQDTACAYIASQSSSSQIKFEDINQIDEDDMDIKWSMALLSMRADKAPKSQDKGRRDNYKQGFNVKEQALKALMEIDGVGWDWSYMANDEEDHALVAVEEAPTEFALMANTSTESKKLEILNKEKEGVDRKLAGFLTASKDLDNLIESQ